MSCPCRARAPLDSWLDAFGSLHALPPISPVFDAGTLSLAPVKQRGGACEQSLQQFGGSLATQTDIRLASIQVPDRW